jgi:hypothetical protein
MRLALSTLAASASIAAMTAASSASAAPIGGTAISVAVAATTLVERVCSPHYAAAHGGHCPPRHHPHGEIDSAGSDDELVNSDGDDQRSMNSGGDDRSMNPGTSKKKKSAKAEPKQ